MTRSRFPAAVAALVLLVRFVAPGATARAEPVARHGTAVEARTVYFQALPPISQPYSGPQTERPEAIDPEAEERFEVLKASPEEILPEQLHQFTLDSDSGGNQTLAPGVGNGFEGISQGGYVPGEPAVAAGPTNVFSTGNVSVTVTDKDGGNRVETDGGAFWGVPAGEGAIFDPQCCFDALHGRFIAIALTQGVTPSNFSYLYLAISQTSDARGAWFTYRFDMTRDGDLATANWADFPALGWSEDKLGFSSQQYRFVDNTYAYQKIRVIDRALAYAGQPVAYVDLTQFPSPSGQTQDVFITKTARDLSPGDHTIHCLCVRTNGGVNVTYREITGPPGAPVMSPGSLVAVSSYTVPPDAPQPGSATLVQTNDCRPADFIVRDGVLVAAWHTSVTLGGAPVSALRLFRLRVADLTVLTDETFGATGVHSYYPAVTADSVGSIFLGFDRSSATEFPSAYATGKRRVDSALQPSALLQAGISATEQSRWGDFTGIDSDASLSGPGGSTAWVAAQFSKAATTFGTWINRVTFTYGQTIGSVTDDSDGSLATPGDHSPAAGVTLTLLQGSTAVATTQTDTAGGFRFGFLETGTYDVVVTPPGGAALDAVPGSGATNQTRISAADVQVVLTNSQTSVGNQFFVSSTHAVPALASLSPPGAPAGSAGLTLTVTGSGFVRASIVRWDGADRATGYVSANQLIAVISTADLATPAIHAVTVFSPPPGGGTSNPLGFSVATGTDHTPPVVALSAPGGGESWAVGSTQTIEWTASDDVGVGNVDLDLSIDGGTSFPFAIAHVLPNSGSYAWMLPGMPTAAARVRVIARDADGNVAADSSRADFTISGWTITATAGAHGAISPAGPIGVADGATPVFSITAAAGYAVSDVSVDAVSVGAVAAYTFGAVHANHTIAATFVISHVYSWIATGSAAWTSPANWSPARDTPASDDVLRFDRGGAVTATGVATQTIAGLVITNSTSVTLQSAVYPTLTLAGGPGAGLDVGAGCGLRLSGTNAITLALPAGVTGSIAGAFDVLGAAHRLTAAGAHALGFQAGSIVTMGTGFAGNLFGTGSGASALNSVDFHGGSLCAQSAGATPFGAAAPLSVVTFEPGSRFRVDNTAVIPALAGRTYADFEMNSLGSLTLTGSSPFGMDSVIVSKGLLNLNVGAGGAIRGSVIVKPSATLQWSPISAATFVLNGVASQTIRILGTLNTASTTTLQINNAAGVTLASNVTLGGPLAFASGRIATGGWVLALGNAAITGASSSTGWVDGALRLPVGTGEASRVFEIGDATRYTPVTVSAHGVATAFDLTAITHPGDHPELATSGLDPGRSVQRFWSLTPSASPDFTGADVTLAFVAGDVDSAADPGQFRVGRWTGGWTLPAVGARTPTSTQALGVAGFGDLVVADPAGNGISVKLLSPNGGELLTAGSIANLTWTATATGGISGIDVLLSRGGAAGPYDSLATGLANSGSYAWMVTGPRTYDAFARIVAHDAAGQTASDASDSAFTILAATAVGDLPVAEFALEPVRPNPVREGAVLRFALPRAAGVRLDIFDLSGRRVAWLAYGELAAGWHEARLRGAPALRPGLYFAHLSVAGRRLVQRFVVTH